MNSCGCYGIRIPLIDDEGVKEYGTTPSQAECASDEIQGQSKGNCGSKVVDYFRGRVSASELSPSAQKSLKAQKIINVARDTTWGFLTALGVDTLFQPWSIDFSSSIGDILSSEAFLKQTGAQWLYSTAVMGVATAGLYLRSKCSSDPRPVSGKELLTHFLGANLSLPVWNIAQVVGTRLGTALFMAMGVPYPAASVAAGFLIAPIFTGLSETFVQTGAQLLSRLKDKENPPTFKELKEGMKYGGFGGAWWQVNLMLCQNSAWDIAKSKLGPYLGSLFTGLSIASGVCFFNDRSAKQIARNLAAEHAPDSDEDFFLQTPFSSPVETFTKPPSESPVDLENPLMN